MRARPVLALSAGLALLGGTLAPALAAVDAPADGPAVGSALSRLTLLDVGLGDRSLSVLELALRSDTMTGVPATSFVVTPLTLDGTTYGRQSLSSRSAVLPAVDSASTAPAALSPVAAVRSPLVDVRSEGGTSSAGTPSLGAVSVLGLPLSLDGTASISSLVGGAGASGGKTLRVGRLALPSLADLLAALGLDLRVLPTDSLTGLTDGLDLGSPTIEQARAALDAALARVQPQVDAAQAAVAGADDAVDGADAALVAARAGLAAATTNLNDATRALTGTVGGLRVGSLVAQSLIDPVLGDTVEAVELVVGDTGDTVDPVVGDTVEAVEPAVDPVTDGPVEPVDEVETVVEGPDPVLDPVLDAVTRPIAPVVDDTVGAIEEVLPAPELSEDPALQLLVDAYDAAKAAYDEALAAVDAAEAALGSATALLAEAVAALDAVLAPYEEQVGALVDAVVDVLDATPLVSLDRLEVTTRSAVTSAEAGGQSAQVVGGEIEGLRVLGTDVLDSAVGSSTAQVLDVTGRVKADVDAAVRGLTTTLSDVLSDVPGLPGLTLPAPTVDLLTSATATDVVDGYGVAGSALRALTVTWPGITVPAAAALPGAAMLPAVTGIPVLDGLAGGAVRTSGDLSAAAGHVVTQPLTLGLATLEDRARFAPGSLNVAPGDGTGSETPGTDTPGTDAPATDGPTTGTDAPAPGAAAPSTTTPDAPAGGGTRPGTVASPRTTPVGLTQLPRTGADSAPAAAALLLVAAALGLHRRSRTA